MSPSSALAGRRYQVTVDTTYTVTSIYDAFSEEDAIEQAIEYASAVHILEFPTIDAQAKEL